MPDQARRMIENSDRGITLNKGLAWTMLCGLIGTGLYVGIAMGNVTTKLEHISARSANSDTLHSNLDARVRLLEQAKSRDDERFTSILTFMHKIDNRLERIENR